MNKIIQKILKPKYIITLILVLLLLGIFYKFFTISNDEMIVCMSYNSDGTMLFANKIFISPTHGIIADNFYIFNENLSKKIYYFSDFLNLKDYSKTLTEERFNNGTFNKSCEFKVLENSKDSYKLNYGFFETVSEMFSNYFGDNNVAYCKIENLDIDLFKLPIKEENCIEK